MKRFIYVAAGALLAAVIVLGQSAKTVNKAIVVADKRTGSAAGAARLGRAFGLRAGQQVSLKDRNLRIKFVAVENDSRCPKNVRCVWAGNAQVSVEISERGGRVESLKLNTLGSQQLSSEGKYRGYTVKLVALSPYPRDGQEIAAGNYTATLMVSKE